MVKRLLGLILVFSLLLCCACSRSGQSESLPAGSQSGTGETAAVPETTGPAAEPGPEAYAKEPPELEPFSITVNIAGDCLLASYKGGQTAFKNTLDQNPPEYFLEGVRWVFEQDDLSIVNLECVLTDRNLTECYKEGTAYWYKGSTSNTSILTCSSVEAVSLANNHTGDYGIEGQMDTIAAVEDADLLWGNEDKTMYWEKDGFVIAVVCCGLWGSFQTDGVVSRIQEASASSDFQIVYYHGGAERIHTPEEWKKQASRQLVDAGADLVIGNHPHVLQPMENYNGVDIVYSLGNFCFGDEMHAENRTVIYQLNLTVNSRGEVLEKTGTVIPCYVYTASMNNFHPTVIEDPEDRQIVLDFMYGNADSPV